jgi:hypothetical protein
VTVQFRPGAPSPSMPTTAHDRARSPAFGSTTSNLLESAPCSSVTAHMKACVRRWMSRSQDWPRLTLGSSMASSIRSRWRAESDSDLLQPAAASDLAAFVDHDLPDRDGGVRAPGQASSPQDHFDLPSAMVEHVHRVPPKGVPSIAVQPPAVEHPPRVTRADQPEEAPGLGCDPTHEAGHVLPVSDRTDERHGVRGLDSARDGG